MPHAHIMVISPHDSGLPEDVTVNNFSLNTAAATILSLQSDIEGWIEDFYAAANVNHPIDWYLSNVLTPSYEIRVYDRADPEPRVPKFTSGLTRSVSFPGSSTPYPSEVAVCLSMQALRISGVDQARRRGRVFIGPLNPGAASFTTGVARVAPIMIQDLITAAQRMNNDAQGFGCRWEVWSPSNGTGADVDNGWIDNAFDTQRRRGERATTRSPW